MPMPACPNALMVPLLANGVIVIPDAILTPVGAPPIEPLFEKDPLTGKIGPVHKPVTFDKQFPASEGDVCAASKAATIATTDAPDIAAATTPFETDFNV